MGGGYAVGMNDGCDDGGSAMGFGYLNKVMKSNMEDI
jgi:hypothetical protein